MRQGRAGPLGQPRRIQRRNPFVLLQMQSSWGRNAKAIEWVRQAAKRGYVFSVLLTFRFFVGNFVGNFVDAIYL